MERWGGRKGEPKVAGESDEVKGIGQEPGLRLLSFLIHQSYPSDI